MRFGAVNNAGTDAAMGIDDLVVDFAEVFTSIAANVTNVVRNTNGTPYNPADDTMTFTLTVTGTGPLGSGWTASAPFSTTGSYGVPKNMTMPIASFAAATHTLTGAVSDIADTTVTEAFSVTAPWCSISVATNTIFVWNENSTPLDPSDDTVSFLATATGQYTGPTYTVTGPFGSQVVSYASPSPVSVPPGSAQTLSYVDDLDPACTGSLFVNMPAIIGTNMLIGGAQRIVSLPSSVARSWTMDSVNRTAVQNSGTQNDHVILSEIVDLTAAADVQISVAIDAIAGTPTTSSSGFEALDHFKCELIVDGNPTPINMLGQADIDSNGQLDGGAALSGSELPDAGVLNETRMFQLSYILPASANSVQIRFTGNSNSPNETFVIRDLLIEAAAAPITTGNPAMGLGIGISGKTKVATILAAAAGGAGQISLSSVQSGPTAEGGTVSIVDGWVVYQPAAGFVGTDTFTYIITDGANSAQGTVTVVIAQAVGRTVNIVGVTPQGATNKIVALGIPGRTFHFETSSDLTSWTMLGTPDTVPASGVVVGIDPGPLPTTRYYRYVQTP
jgi:hypothetical protein